MTAGVGEQPVCGRVAMAQAVSGVLGVPVSVHQLDRLMTRTDNPLPVHGYPGRWWLFVSEVQTWWEEADGESRDSDRRMDARG